MLHIGMGIFRSPCSDGSNKTLPLFVARLLSAMELT